MDIVVIYVICSDCDVIPRDNRCMYMRMFVFMSIVVTVWGYAGMLIV